jgi:ankyrin repeat protein
LFAVTELTIDARADGNYTPLHEAALRGHTTIAQQLLEKKAAVHSRTSFGVTPLYCAAEFGKLDVVALLLAHQAHINEVANDGTPPLNVAADKNHFAVVDLLLRYGADMRLKDRGKTAFDWTTEPAIQRRLLLAEINSAIEIACPVKQPHAATVRLFAPAAVAQLVLLKKAVTENNAVQIAQLKDQFQDTVALKELYRKATVYAKTISSLTPTFTS